MSEINKLVYFLNSTKDILPFENKEDFNKKIKESKDFRIKVQKLVYLSKYFGWENPYIFTLAPRGPYSVELKHNYLKKDLFDNMPQKIEKLNLSSLIEFVSQKNTLFLEATTTILYQFKEKTSEKNCVSSIQSLKEHISPNIILDAYNNINDYNLYEKNNIASLSEVNILQKQVISKIEELTKYFEKFEYSSNRIIVLGSMDYMRISIRESNLNLQDTFYMLMFIKRYLEIIEKLSKNVKTNDVFTYLNLDNLEELFNQFQDFVSKEHHILKKIDDDNFDERLCY